MRKKTFSIIIMLVVMIASFSNIYATTEQLKMFDVKAYQEIYKLSEDEEGINLPFFNFFEGAAVYDKAIHHSGITFGDSTVEIDEKLEGVHVIFSTDMISVKGELENALIYGNNVVVSGKITSDAMLIGNTVTITEKADIDKDLVIIADKLNIEGNVDGNVIATVSTQTNISGKIGKDLRAITTNIDVSNSDIKGGIYLETDANSEQITQKYKDAIIYRKIVEEPEEKIDISSIISKGVITVVIYTLICYLINKKDNNFMDKAYTKFKENVIFGTLLSFVAIISVIVVPVLLLLLAIFGLGIVAWPILIIYTAVLLFVCATAYLIVGLTTYSAIKKVVGKYKLPAMIGIFTVLYVLSQITMISYYVSLAVYLIALAIIITMVTKKMPLKASDNKENK